MTLAPADSADPTSKPYFRSFCVGTNLLKRLCADQFTIESGVGQGKDLTFTLTFTLNGRVSSTERCGRRNVQIANSPRPAILTQSGWEGDAPARTRRLCGGEGPLELSRRP